MDNIRNLGNRTWGAFFTFSHQDKRGAIVQNGTKMKWHLLLHGHHTNFTKFETIHHLSPHHIFCNYPMHGEMIIR
jgi:hypothetical protein